MPRQFIIHIVYYKTLFLFYGSKNWDDLYTVTMYCFVVDAQFLIYSKQAILFKSGHNG